MDPSYQRRGDLWPLRHRQLLLNSILNHYDIPKIYLADFTYMSSSLNEGRKPYAVIDGKQRLKTIFDFFDGNLLLDDTPVFVGKEEFHFGGLSYNELKRRHAFAAQRVEDFVPTVMSVISDRLEEIQELFIRLNLNVSISGAERRNALPGPLPKLIRDLSVHTFFRKNATFPISRGQDLNLAAKYLLMEHVRSFASMKKADLDRFVLSGAKANETDYREARDRVRENLNAMSRVFLQRDPLLYTQAELTIFYWLIREFGRVPDIDLRAGIVAFEDARRTARSVATARAAGQDVPAPDQDLLYYNTVVRSPDDKSTQEKMFATMKQYLQL
jgi:Protein of unknown function DUF262